jgi:HSP20 family molecular chaperone IbpA
MTHPYQHQHIEDPYYGLDKRPPHHGVSVPRFDVREDENSFYLDGEVPGLTNVDEIFTEVIDGLTLIVRGALKQKKGAEHAQIPEQYGTPLEVTFESERTLSNSHLANGEANKTGAIPKEGEQAMIWKLGERHVGPFERSFTFPSHFKYGSMETGIEAGVLSITLLKDHEADKIAVAQLEVKSEI